MPALRAKIRFGVGILLWRHVRFLYTHVVYDVWDVRLLQMGAWIQCLEFIYRCDLYCFFTFCLDFPSVESRLDQLFCKIQSEIYLIGYR